MSLTPEEAAAIQTEAARLTAEAKAKRAIRDKGKALPAEPIAEAKPFDLGCVYMVAVGDGKIGIAHRMKYVGVKSWDIVHQPHILAGLVALYPKAMELEEKLREAGVLKD